MSQWEKLIPQDKVLIVRKKLESASEDCYDSLNSLKLKKPKTTLLLSIFLGGLGVDRFYIGDTGVGVCKLLFGVCTAGIWPFVDIFISYKKAKEKNFTKISNSIY